MLALLAAVVLGATYWWLSGPDATPVLASRGSDKAAVAPVARIDLGRLEAERPDVPAGHRNIFDYGKPPAPPPPDRSVVVHPLPTPTPAGGGAGGIAVAGGTDASAMAGAPLNVKYIGTVDNGRGVKVAVLLTDRDEVLTGQAGQVVANRYRIARIGIESVDLEDVGTGVSRRIALRGSGS